MSKSNNISKTEYINKDNNIPTLPPHPIETPPRQPGEPSALEKLAAFAASIAAEDRLLEERRANEAENDSGYTGSGSDDDDDDDDDVDHSSNNRDFFRQNLPFRMRTTSLPAAIEGQRSAEVAQAVLRKIWATTVTRRSTSCLVSVLYRSTTS